LTIPTILQSLLAAKYVNTAHRLNTHIPSLYSVLSYKKNKINKVNKNDNNNTTNNNTQTQKKDINDTDEYNNNINSNDNTTTTTTTTTTIDSSNNDNIHLSADLGTTPTLSLLKKALFLIEAALPHGSIDRAEDKWGTKKQDFCSIWRESVIAATDATTLMQCQLMLEYCLKQTWLKPLVLKSFTFLQSRAFAMRNATIGMVRFI
jgi:hypothetical protein